MIFYDDGQLLNMDLSEQTLFAVRFTPVKPFNLNAVSVMFLNDRDTTDGAEVWVAESKSGMPAWPAISVGQIRPPLADRSWVQYNLAGSIYFGGDFFIIIRQKGSLFYPAYPSPSFWVGIDHGTTTRRTLKSYNNGQTWVTETMRDALIRAGGSYNSPPCSPSSPSPISGATGVPTTTSLQWMPCPYAFWQDVYFGTELNAVLTASRTSPLYQGQLPGSASMYTPEIPLSPCTTYYWRIDTVPCSTCPPTKGPVQSFTTTCSDRPSCLPGDINGDGIVNLKDLGILASYWLQESQTPCTVGTIVYDVNDCGSLPEELVPPQAPKEGYVYLGVSVVINSRATLVTEPLDRQPAPDDIHVVYSRKIVRDGVVVCDVVVVHTFVKKK